MTALHNSDTPPPATSHSATWRLVLLVTLLTAAVWCSRSAYIAAHHSPCMDANYHLVRGYAQLTGNPYQLAVSRNDGPLGQMLMALPLVVLGCDPGQPITPHHWAGDSVPGSIDGTSIPEDRQVLQRGQRTSILMGHALSPDTLHIIISVWKTLLMVPAVLIAYLFVRRLAGPPAAWLCWAMLTADPTLAAHTSALALDALGAAFIFLAVMAMLRYLSAPTAFHACLLGLALAAALLTKHTAIPLLGILPLICLCARYFGQPVAPTAQLSYQIFRQHLALFLLTAALCVWLFTGLDISRPIDSVADKLDIRPLPGFFLAVLMTPLPAGVYLGGLFNGFLHVADQSPAYLVGFIHEGGWWYYFLLVWFLKTPLPLSLAVLAGLVALIYHSLTSRLPAIISNRQLLLAAVLYLLFFCFTSLNTGLRHFLPAMVLCYVCAALGIGFFARRYLVTVASSVVALAFVMTLSAGPNLMSYVPWIVPKPVLWFTESNLDWNQSLKQTRAWLLQHQKENPSDTTPIYFVPRPADLPDLAWHIKPQDFPNLRILTRFSSPPDTGLVIISPVLECGVYDEARRWGFLLIHMPLNTIGDNYNVYRLEGTRP